MPVHVHMWVRACVCVRVHTHTHTHAHAHTHICMHTHAHTHICTSFAVSYFKCMSSPNGLLIIVNVHYMTTWVSIFTKIVLYLQRVPYLKSAAGGPLHSPQEPLQLVWEIDTHEHDCFEEKNIRNICRFCSRST